MSRRSEELRDRFANTSVGAAMEAIRSQPSWCEYAPGNGHMPSGDALAAGVEETRCLVCRRRIREYRGQWLSDYSPASSAVPGTGETPE